MVHYGFIENFIDELGKKFHIKEIAFDRWGAVQMSQNLEGLGFTMVQFGQGYKDLSPPSKELMKLPSNRNLLTTDTLFYAGIWTIFSCGLTLPGTSS